MLPYIMLNVVVSAIVVLAILFWWNNRQPEEDAIIVERSPLLDENNNLVTPTIPADQPPPATETPTLTPTPEIFVHIVAPGDTLGQISTIYGVTVDDILRANGRTDPNIISVGEEIIIPIGGYVEPEPTPTPTQEAQFAPTPIPTEPLASGEVIIEIREVIGVDDLPNEAVSIINKGSGAIALQNWKVVDQQGFEYVFSEVTLFGDGAGILLHTETGVSTPLELYWGLENAVWSPNETVSLLDSEGTVRATYVIPGE